MMLLLSILPAGLAVHAGRPLSDPVSGALSLAAHSPTPTEVRSDAMAHLWEPVDHWQLPGQRLGPQLAPPWAETLARGSVVEGPSGPQTDGAPAGVSPSFVLQAWANASRTAGPAPLTVGFETSVRGDPAGYYYYDCSFDYGDGARAGPSNSYCYARTGTWTFGAHTFTAPGTYLVTFEAIDTQAQPWHAFVNLTITVTPPTVSAAWTLLTTPASPSARTGAAAAYDPAMQAVLLFGGAGARSAPLGDTWAFEHGVWTNLSAGLSTAPSPRYGAMMTYDAADGYLLLVGGSNSSVRGLNDVWVFSNDQWQLEGTLPSSLGSWSYAPDLTYDPVAAAVALIGRYPNPTPSASPLDFYHAGTWWQDAAVDSCTLLDPLTFDSTDAYLVSVGGNDTYGTCLYQNGAWKVDTWSPEPPFGGWEQMVDDPAAQGVLLPFTDTWPRHSCSGPTSCVELWSLSGANWTNLTSLLTAMPDGRAGAAMAYDPAEGYVLYFGGGTSTTLFGDTWTLNVTSSTTLHVAASATPDPVGFGTPCTLDAATAGGSPPYSWSWDLGDGSTATGATVSHIYSTPGTFTATVVATDSTGASASTSVTVVVTSPPALSATASADPTTGVAPLLVQFTGAASGGAPPYAFAWTGVPCTAPRNASFSCTIYATGTFTVQLLVTDARGNSATSAALMVTVDPNGSSSVLIQVSGEPTSGTAPLAVQFCAQVAGGLAPYTYAWTFGNGGASSEACPAYTYPTPGTYEATVLVNDSGGNSAIASLRIQVNESGGGGNGTVLVGSATATSVSACAPVNVVFQASATGGVPPYTFLWNFTGAGTVQGPATISYNYSVPGTYHPRLTVEDQVGDSATLPAIAIVNATSCGGGDLPLNVSFWSSSFPREGSPTQFTAVVQGGAVPYQVLWNFGDGTTFSSTSLSTTHTFAMTGEYAVFVLVTDASGRRGISSVLYVQVSAPGGARSGSALGDPAIVAGLVLGTVGITALAGFLLLRPPRRRASGGLVASGASPAPGDTSKPSPSTPAGGATQVRHPPTILSERIEFDPQSGAIALRQRSLEMPPFGAR
ncbi:MAG: PKD domain-containing protein [Euryarchaeota archaeon]|nr:PKD domain-containing protein [Euryarchaeota archaeon]MDE1836421.1 PKD domain-containing protein [Euryarchaeota archaeon]MDE1879064.1 PKD domain-containing protein [Euryarchaeota archaeon]MDE2044169.1 PKD domain-containing protein [Thermoplasmata archaeon]